MTACRTQHYPAPATDLQRDRVLAAGGILVMRFSNEMILNRTGQVLSEIRLALHERCPQQGRA